MFSDKNGKISKTGKGAKRPKTPLYRAFARKLDEKGKILTTRFTGLNNVNVKNGRKTVYRDSLVLNKQNNAYLVSVGKDNFKMVPSHSSLTLMANTFMHTFIIIAGTLQLYNLMANQNITFVEAYIKSKLLEELWIKENLPIIEKFKNLWVLRWDSLVRTKEFIEKMDKYVKIALKHVEIEMMMNEKKPSSFDSIIDKIDIKKKLSTHYNKIKDIEDIDSYQPFYKKHMEEIIKKGTLYSVKVSDSIKLSSKEFLQRKKKRFPQNVNPQNIGNNFNENNKTYLRQELIALTAFFSRLRYKLKKGDMELLLDGSQITNISYPGAANTVLESMIKITNFARNKRGNNKLLRWRTIRFKKVEISEAQYRHMRKIEEFNFYEQFLDTAFFELFPEEEIINPDKVIASYTAEKLIRIK